MPRRLARDVSILVIDVEGTNEPGPRPAAMRRLPVMVIAPRHTSNRLRDELRLGVRGVVTTDDSLSTLASALDHISAGRAFVSPTAATLVFDCLERDREGFASSSSTLSSRELEVVRAMAEGLSTRAIAQKLGITTKTVEAHSTRIFMRLDAASRAEAVARATASGQLQDLAQQSG
jgi:DNA-binding NarL/FixJ family response regulator